jgi:signal transduction histidine kinase/ligand-binding sensor domain-containing protein
MNRWFRFHVSIFVGSLFSGLSVFAQDIHFAIVQKAQESMGSIIVGMTQDQNGFLWFATQNGLYKYNGTDFIVYHAQQLDPNSPSDDEFECVLADREGFIWAGHFFTSGGLERLDPATGLFTHFHRNENDPTSLGSDTVTAILQSRNGTIWIGTYGGLDRYDGRTNTFFHFRHNSGDTNSLSSNQVRALYEDKDGTLWVGSGEPWVQNNKQHEGGLNKLNVKTGKFTRYLHKENDSTSLVDNRIRAIFEDSHGNFWVGSAGDGLHKMDRKKGTFKRFTYNPSRPGDLSSPPVKNNNSGPDDHITSFIEDSKGRLWIITFRGGINVYDPSTQKISYYGTGNNSKEKIPESLFWASYKTRDGIIWLSTWGGNLYKINPYDISVPSTQIGHSIFAFAEDDAKNLLLATDHGLIMRDSSGNQKQFLNDKDSSAPGNYINYCEKTDKYNFWISTLHGLFTFNSQTKTLAPYYFSKTDGKNLLSDTIYLTKKTRDNLLLLATNHGLGSLDLKTGAIKIYKKNPNDSNSISNETIYALTEDSKGNLWVGTANGLNLLDNQSGKFKRLISKAIINCITEDYKGVLWVATSQGIFSYDLETGKFTLSGILSNIANPSESSWWIEEDHENNLWVNDNTGIIRVNKERNEVIQYSGRQGVIATNLNNFGFTRQNGDVLFGNKKGGYYTFNNNLFGINLPKPEVVFTGFLLSDSLVQPSPNGVLNSSINQTSEIRLSHEQNTFSFEFSPLYFVTSHEDMRTQYMLENYDNKWRNGGDNRFAYYFNLSPGSYIFRVKTYSANGTSSEKDISVIISPPWWKTWWAYVIYGICLFALILTIDRAQRRRIIKRERERTRDREIAQAKEIEKAYSELKNTQTQLIQQEKMASLGELTAGIAHEIQNPLNFINNFSEVNKELIEEMQGELKTGNNKEAIAISNNIKENEDKISHHGKRADTIVKGMLQHSRSSSGVKEPTNINALADEYFRLAYYGIRAKDRDFNATMITEFDPAVGFINIIPQEIGRVLLNLFNNAFYVVDEKKKQRSAGYEPAVSVSTKRIDNKVEIRVKDNGNGIPQKVINKIFQPFFTTKPPGQGTGLGLSLSYDIVKAHGGEIKVDTLEGAFTEFIITLPS